MALRQFLGELAKTKPGESAASIARSLKRAQRVEFLDKLSRQQRAWDLFVERRILMEQGRKPGILTTEQVNSIRAVEESGESIWSSEVGSTAMF